MIDIKIAPASLLRLYLWALLDLETPMERIDGLVPIVPVEDEPRLSESEATYAIYGYAENVSYPLAQIREGVFSMRIRARSFTELSHVINVLVRAFEDPEVATENVNLWTTHYDAADLEGIRFTDIHITHVEGGAPPATEGGRSEGIVNLGFKYISRQTVKQFIPAGTKIRNPNGTYSTTTQDQWA